LSRHQLGQRGLVLRRKVSQFDSHFFISCGWDRWFVRRLAPARFACNQLLKTNEFQQAAELLERRLDIGLFDRLSIPPAARR
jgi:hypothetical protein